jgi:hypothetical protein
MMWLGVASLRQDTQVGQFFLRILSYLRDEFTALGLFKKYLKFAGSNQKL